MGASGRRNRAFYANLPPVLRFPAYCRGLMAWRLLAALFVAGALMLVVNLAGGAAFNPYVSGTTGYDYSYLQCGAKAPSASFGIVGVNAGYPFTYYNSCLAAEFAAAAGSS